MPPTNAAHSEQICPSLTDEHPVRLRAGVLAAMVILGTTPWVLASAARPQQALVGDVFKPVKADFESELRTVRASDLGPERGFNADDVNSILSHARRQIISKVPADDAPLIQYVQARVPKPVETEKVFVTRSEAESKFSVIEDLLSKLGGLSSFRLDLTINTTPPKAKFELVPPVGSTLSAATDATLANVYRGEYQYVVTKNGYKSIHSTINFIDRSGSTLECELFSDTVPQEALPCNLK